jgi:predicted membrane protein
MKTRQLVLTALLIALGLILPMLFHAVGLGKAFLPMHLPALLAGFILGPVSGLCVGLVTPLLSSLLTGIPPISPPIAFLMMAELGIYGLAGGLMYRKWRLGVYPSLLVAIASGRLIYGLLGSSLMPLLGFRPIPVFYLFTAGLLEAIPGIVLQLIIVPIAVAIGEQNMTILWQGRRA